MLKVKELLKQVALEALIWGVKKHVIWRKLYALPDKNLSKVKQFMENHIRVEGVSLLWHEPLYFCKDNQREWPSNEVIKVVKSNILVPPLRHVPPKNLPYRYHSDHFRMYNP